jgi:hypothetical protein
MELTDTGFDASVLSEFRARLVDADAAQQLLERLLERLRVQGLLVQGGRQRTDATCVGAAVRELNRLELVVEVETLRAAGKRVSPARRRRAVEHLQQVFEVSQRWAYQLVGQHRSTQRHQLVEPERDRALREQLRQLSRAHPRWGYRRAHAVLREQGWMVNRKAIQRLWREEGLRVPSKHRKRQRLGNSTCPADRLAAEHPDHVWALDTSSTRPKTAGG